MKNKKEYSKEQIEITYNRYKLMIWRVCLSYLKNIQDAEDAMSKVFIQYIDKAVVFKSDEHEKAWLLRTAINICKNELKIRSRNNDNIEDYLDVLTRPESESNNQSDELLQAILELKPRQKAVLYMFYYEGYKTEDIAKILDIPASTVRNDLRDSRIILKKKLGGHNE